MPGASSAASRPRTSTSPSPTWVSRTRPSWCSSRAPSSSAPSWTWAAGRRIASSRTRCSRGCAPRGDEPEDFLEKLRGMDAELLEYLLREFTVVHDLEENPDVNPEGVTMETPEGRYLLEFKEGEGAELAGLRNLLNDLIAENPFEAV